ncbi:Uncharacterized protein FKW44_007562 [Caligus rogercresseyi]|uniref:Reverse transcriptase domain-containing protein n=1 Tax=Caligus rogercresseyi TaxID=217165 RepID=A0A7T8KEW7_CALRO|nr:Uncharacterized protein FKW44_007562 [Caligus rogercresseyi]
MQVRVDEACEKHLAVKVNKRPYQLTRMGFGLNCGPEIIKAIFNVMIGQDKKIESATDSYFDDIIVDTEKVNVEEVRRLLKKFDLECKEPVPLENERVLGLQLTKNC